MTLLFIIIGAVLFISLWVWVFIKLRSLSNSVKAVNDEMRDFYHKEWFI